MQYEPTVFLIKMQFVYREVETEIFLFFRQTSVFKRLTNQRYSIVRATFQTFSARKFWFICFTYML